MSRLMAGAWCSSGGICKANLNLGVSLARGVQEGGGELQCWCGSVCLHAWERNLKEKSVQKKGK